MPLVLVKYIASVPISCPKIPNRPISLPPYKTAANPQLHTSSSSSCSFLRPRPPHPSAQHPRKFLTPHPRQQPDPPPGSTKQPHRHKRQQPETLADILLRARCSRPPERLRSALVVGKDRWVTYTVVAIPGGGVVVFGLGAAVRGTVVCGADEGISGGETGREGAGGGE